MPPLARRNLFHDKVRLAVTLTGIAFSVVLMVVESGLFQGFSKTTSSVIDHSRADLWIAGKNTAYIDQATSFSERKYYQALATPGVQEVQKCIVRWTEWKEPDGRTESVEVVGFNPDSSMGGPWNMVTGDVQQLKQPNAVIIDEIYKQKLAASRIGELMLLMGPSGSGKTTLLSIMGCILRPSSGNVFLGDEDVTGMDEKTLPSIRLRHIGFVFQGFNLFPTLTAGENVELSLKLKGHRSKAAKEEARRLLSLVHLEGKYDAYPSDISGGQKQRVAIARAVAGSPEIILADEPTAALDSHAGKTVVEMMMSLAHEQNRAVVIVTHDNRIVEYADRIVRIEDGRVA